MSKSKTQITGTKEWAANNVNCILGCPHNCRYCYRPTWNRHSKGEYEGRQSGGFKRRQVGDSRTHKQWATSPSESSNKGRGDVFFE